MGSGGAHTHLRVHPRITTHPHPPTHTTSALGAPLVGILAQRAFGFSGAAELSPDPELNKQRAASLGSALLVFTALPWLLCAAFFSGLHWTYPLDRRRAAAAAAAAEGARAEGGGKARDGNTQLEVELVGERTPLRVLAREQPFGGC